MVHVGIELVSRDIRLDNSNGAAIMGDGRAKLAVSVIIHFIIVVVVGGDFGRVGMRPSTCAQPMAS